MGLGKDPAKLKWYQQAELQVSLQKTARSTPVLSHASLGTTFCARTLLYQH